MFTRNRIDRFTTHLVSGLVVTATIAIGALAYAVSHIQVVA
jgi:hypothetical protein